MKWLFAAFLLLFSQALPAQHPVFVPELPFHHQAVTAAYFSAGGSRIISASENGPLMVYAATDGRLLRSIFLPFEGGVPARFTTFTVSSDGTRIFAAGNQRDPLTGKTPVFQLETSTGRLLSNRLPEGPDIQRLALLESGGVLLAVSKNGVRGLSIAGNRTVFFRPFQEVPFIGNLPGDSVWVAVWQNRVQFLDGKGAPVDSMTFPFSILPASFTAAGRRSFAAIGSDRQSMLVATNGSLSKTAAGTVFSRLDAVAIRNNMLEAAGLNKTGVPVLRRFDPKTGWLAAEKTLPGAVRALSASGNNLLAAGDPPFLAVWNADTLLFEKRSPVPAYNRADRSHFVVSDNGLAFSVHPSAGEPMHFSLEKRGFLQEKPAGRPFREQLNTATVTNWKLKNVLVWNGRPVSGTASKEVFLSVDIGDDGFLAAGTGSHLFVVHPDGEIRQRIPVPAPAWNVRYLSEKQWIVAALGDGSVRWYHTQTGKQLWALLLHADRRNWVLWTADGFYDATPGGVSMISWLLSRGSFAEPQVFDASRFRNQRYKPDTLDRRIGVKSPVPVVIPGVVPAPVVQQVTLPPVLRIIQPADGAVFTSTKLSFRVSAETTDTTGLQPVLAYIDGRPASVQRALSINVNRTDHTIELTLPPRDCTVSFVARNRSGYSKPEVISLRWGGVSETSRIKPTLYVLAIGAGGYKAPIPPLGYPAKDARDLAAVLKKQSGLLYKDVQVRLLDENEATKGNILDGLEWIQRQTTARDVAMIFLAGHGINDAAGDFYFVPSDASADAIKRTCVVYADLKNTITAIAGKVIVFIDACHSGNVFGGRRSWTTIDAVVSDLASAENGVVVFTSSTGRQYSLEKPEWGNGAFTKALVEGLSGKADLFGRKVVSIKTLDAYVADRVKELTRGEQTPTMIVPQSIPDYPIVIIPSH
jgi:WD40 repeat protein